MQLLAQVVIVLVDYEGSQETLDRATYRLISTARVNYDTTDNRLRNIYQEVRERIVMDLRALLDVLVLFPVDHESIVVLVPLLGGGGHEGVVDVRAK